MVPVANLLTAGHEVPWWRGAAVLWTLYGGFLLLVLVAVSDRAGAAIDRAVDRASALLLRPSPSTFALGAAVATIAAAIGVALYCYAGRAFTGDEMAMAWHAQILRAGRLSIPAPSHPEFFSGFGVVEDSRRWYSQFPVGGPALLSLGLRAGAVWFVNPVLLGIATWQLYQFARRACDEFTARAAALLFILSPFVLVVGATQLSHTASLALALIALAELAAWDASAARAQSAHAAAVGLAVGSIALMRPFDAVLVALPIAVFQLGRLRHAPDRIAGVVIQCAAGAAAIALALWVNARTTGQPLLFAYDAAHGAAHGIGFHVDPTGEMHTPTRGLVYASGYLMRLNRFLFEWPLPGLLIVCATLVMLPRATRWDALLLGLLASFTIGFAAYWFNGFFDGPRFLYPIAPVLILYAARFAEAAARAGNPARRRMMRLVVPVCVLCAWLVPAPLTSVPVRLRALREQRTKYKTDVAAQARQAAIADAVVFVHESWHERLLARLRALGIRPFDAERAVKTLDACALQTALDAADTTAERGGSRAARVLAYASSVGRALRVPGGTEETRLARAPNGPDTPRCRDELASDTLMAMPYGIFQREQQFDRAGRFAGPAIYARDLGARDSLLRAELGARRWYLYVPGASMGDRATFVPIGRR